MSEGQAAHCRVPSRQAPATLLLTPTLTGEIQHSRGAKGYEKNKRATWQTYPGVPVGRVTAQPGQRST